MKKYNNVTKSHGEPKGEQAERSENLHLEIVVFICGAVVMILEIAGSRIMAPYLGTSLFVWTSIIGVILGSLSLGYFLGGKIADKKASFKTFSIIIFLSAIFIALIALTKEWILEFVEANFKEVRLGSLVAATTIFAPASIFLGMISPYAVKLKLENLQKSGRTVGNLYAISTIGSIVGTFLAGFFLLSYFGNTKLLIILSITLVFTSLIAHFGNNKTKLLAILLLIIQFITFSIRENSLAKAGIIELETDYNNVRIYQDADFETGEPIQILDLGKADHSAIFLDNNDLVFEYTKFYRLAKHFNPELKDALAIGAGAYTYPRDFLSKFPEANLDVVELDPGLTEIAKKYFHLKDNERLNIYHEDGRTFLNRNTKKYDVIFGDAFRSYYSIPYQLTTVEAVQKMHDSLNDDGVAFVNVISSLDGKTGKFLQAEYKTFKEVFPQVYIFPVKHPENPLAVQNIILVALKSEEKPEFASEDPELNTYLQNLYLGEIKTDLPILTDDFAPVDQYIMELL